MTDYWPVVLHVIDKMELKNEKDLIFKSLNGKCNGSQICLQEIQECWVAWFASDISSFEFTRTLVQIQLHLSIVLSYNHREIERPYVMNDQA